MICISYTIDKLDNLEEIRKHLYQLGNKNLEDIMDDLPQIIAIGAQSAGKSSVIYKITGVPLPSGTGTCTKIASRILSRRGEKESVIISLENIDGTHIDNIYESNSLEDTNIEKELQNAQKNALETSDS